MLGVVLYSCLFNREASAINPLNSLERFLLVVMNPLHAFWTFVITMTPNNLHSAVFYVCPS